MKTVKQYEKENNVSLPNPYFHDHKNNKTPTITFVWFGLTPTGRISKYNHQIRFYKGDKYPTLETVLQRVREKYSPLPEKLPKNYQWTDALIQHDFWHVEYEEKTESVNWHEEEHEKIFAQY